MGGSGNKYTGYLQSWKEYPFTQHIVSLLFYYLRPLGHPGFSPTTHRNVQMILRDRVQGWTQQWRWKCHHSFQRNTPQTLCFLWLRERFFSKKKRAQCLILCALSGRNKPTILRICHFSKWLRIKQNDFAVHHRLNSARNVINLYKSWKQSLYLEAVTVTNCKATGS